MVRTTVGRYLVTRLEELGLRHVFGVPGDYVLSFYDLLEESEIDLIGTCTEIGAGYAADAYARINGLGALCVTYCVGGLNALNAVAGAYAEKSPVIAISGAPGLNERVHSPLLHHVVRSFDTQQKIYQQVTVASYQLEDPVAAPNMIDEALEACIWNKRPVYLEIPRDMVNQPCCSPEPFKALQPESDKESLTEAVTEAADLLKKAKNPVILAGVEVHRFGLVKPMLKLVEKSGFKIAATILGKSVISECHPQYLGVYEGAMGHESVRRKVEDSDCILILGAFMTDVNLGFKAANIPLEKTIYVHSGKVTIKHHHYENIYMGHFIEKLAETKFKRPAKSTRPRYKTIKTFKPQKRKPIKVQRFFNLINNYLEDNTVVICDAGDSLFGGIDLTIHKKTEFLSPAYYTSMGFAVPAAIGTQINNRSLRPILFVGDGAFQMTSQELSTISRHKLNPIIFVLNNQGYTTERFIHEGDYNDIREWAYHKLPSVMRDGWGCEVKTEGELEEALATAKSNKKSFSLINVHLDKMDCSDALIRLGNRIGKKIK